MDQEDVDVDEGGYGEIKMFARCLLNNGTFESIVKTRSRRLQKYGGRKLWECRALSTNLRTGRDPGGGGVQVQCSGPRKRQDQDQRSRSQRTEGEPVTKRPQPRYSDGRDSPSSSRCDQGATKVAEATPPPRGMRSAGASMTSERAAGLFRALTARRRTPAPSITVIPGPPTSLPRRRLVPSFVILPVPSMRHCVTASAVNSASSGTAILVLLRSHPLDYLKVLAHWASHPVPALRPRDAYTRRCSAQRSTCSLNVVPPCSINSPRTRATSSHSRHSSLHPTSDDPLNKVNTPPFRTCAQPPAAIPCTLCAGHPRHGQAAARSVSARLARWARRTTARPCLSAMRSGETSRAGYSGRKHGRAVGASAAARGRDTRGTRRRGSAGAAVDLPRFVLHARARSRSGFAASMRSAARAVRGGLRCAESPYSRGFGERGARAWGGVVSPYSRRYGRGCRGRGARGWGGAERGWYEDEERGAGGAGSACREASRPRTGEMLGGGRAQMYCPWRSANRARRPRTRQRERRVPCSRYTRSRHLRPGPREPASIASRYLLALFPRFWLDLRQL
ncbi:hypothetical protein DFH09DRAFT_1089201 [Mycena vulgaris]|nr:hypothetical protein DFH09DRAFT_1089201 [Mycena vulgaris]